MKAFFSGHSRYFTHSGLLTNLWVLASLLLMFLPASLQAGSLPANQPPAKTPAEATVRFQVQTNGNPLTLCSAARISHTELVTSATCLKELIPYLDRGISVQAVSGNGEGYGEIVQDTEQEATTDYDSTPLVIITLAPAKGEQALWPTIHVNELAVSSALAVHREPTDVQAPDHKRSVVDAMLLGDCQGDICTVHSGEEHRHLSDGEPVFHGGQVLCVNSGSKHCIRARSMTRKQAGEEEFCRPLSHSSPAGTAMYAEDEECITEGCANGGDCCIYNYMLSRAVICSNCNGCDVNSTCIVHSNLDFPSTCFCHSDRSRSCEFEVENYPVTKSIGFISGVSATAVTIIAVLSCYISCKFATFCGGKDPYLQDDTGEAITAL